MLESTTSGPGPGRTNSGPVRTNSGPGQSTSDEFLSQFLSDSDPGLFVDWLCNPTAHTPTQTNELIMITGGWTLNVELLYPDGTHMCELEPLPGTRVHHTQSGLITCGGKYTDDSCLIFSLSDGTWQDHGSTLKQHRDGHSSSRRGNTTLLIGGSARDSSKTTEMISMDGTPH